MLTAEAKSLLSRTIRELHDKLLADVHAEVEGIYRLSVPLEKAGLDEARRVRRQRLEAWIEERARTVPPKERAAARERFRAEAEKEAAYTFLHRIVYLRQLEHFGLSKPAVVAGGWKSKGYGQFRDFAPGLLDDGTEGYETLLGLLFEELAQELPGLFGTVGISKLIRIPPATLRAVVTALNDPELDSAWGDDTTLGWVYQYWNDPDREALDRKIADGGKVEPHEIASKTQMFTERYMVEWLLQNSLGTTWLAMCRRHGWRADAEDVFPGLEERRKEWREKREKGEVALDALMPVDEKGLEGRWKYYVPQELPAAVIEKAPESVSKLKLLDPACGSGHFLVIAFDLLAALYREEAHHTRKDWDDAFIARSILENNLHGIDIDPRPIQIAAAALTLKARTFCRDAAPGRLNLVAASLRLGDLPKDDPALLELRRRIREEAGIPEALTDRIVEGLKGADHLGTLLKVDHAVEEALREQERVALVSQRPTQGDLLSRTYAPRQEAISLEEARRSVLDRLEEFLKRHSGENDLGLRLDGEQLAAGIRFVRMVKESAYDVVVGNPPYQGTSKMKEAKYVASKYPDAKADLYAAFLERGLQLVREGGLSAMVTMRGWMFLSSFADVRRLLFAGAKLAKVADLDYGSFSEMKDVSAAMMVFVRSSPTGETSFIRPVQPKYVVRDSAQPARNASGLRCPARVFSSTVAAYSQIDDWPLPYWWEDSFLRRYLASEKLSQVAPVRQGMPTSDNSRFLRFWWEPVRTGAGRTESPRDARLRAASGRWAPYIKGGESRVWVEPLVHVVRWACDGLEIKIQSEHRYGSVSKRVQSEAFYFVVGVAFTMIGRSFSARVHRYPSIFGNKGSSVFPKNVYSIVSLLNSGAAREVLESLNPGIGFEVGDVNRLAVFTVEAGDQLSAQVEKACTVNESAREPSIEFRRPGPSPWRYAQDWAQRAVDRPAGEPLPPYEPEYDPPRPIDFVSFAIGVALGRFGANGEGLLDTAPATALPLGVLFLSDATGQDSLGHEATRPLRDTWAERGAAVGEGDDLRSWLRTGFFKHHKEVYENRPIYFPLSSERKSFVAWCSIHRWNETPGGTLQALLADHLLPERRRLEGQLADVRQQRASATGKEKTTADKRANELQRLKEELDAFISNVTALLEQGPPPADAQTPPREVDARHAMDLDDGVMVNSAALWPVLEPQWKDPKKWWKQLAQAKGKKDYDWSHIAARYFPSRVDAKAKAEPSMAVAHGVFWKYHPATAFRWELRLQDEIGPEFRLEEAGSDEARAAFERDFPKDAAELRRKEEERRERKRRREEPDQEEMFDAQPNEESADDDDEAA